MQSSFIIAIATALLLSPPAVAQSLDWHDADAVVRQGLDRHPVISALDARVVAAEERSRAAGAFPNPMLMTGIQDQQVDLTRDEMMTMYMVGAAQTFPRKARRDAVRHAARLDVDQLRLEDRSLREELRRDLLVAYYGLAAVDGQIRATGQLALAVDTIVAAARFRYETGSTIQADVIRAQLQRTEIEHRLLALRGQRRLAASRLLARLNMPGAEIPPLTLAHATGGQGLDGPPSIPADHPALAVAANEVSRREQDIELARLLARPDWSLEASYGVRPTEKDMFSVTARIELPVRRNTRIAPQIRAAVAERDAATLQIEAIRRRLLEDLGAAHAEHAEATEQLRLHHEVLVPQSKLAFDSTLVAYQSGKDNFESVLATEVAWLNLEIDYYDYLARHIQAITEYEALQRGARTASSDVMGSAPGRPATRPPTGGMSAEVMP